ncbi:MAG: transcription-repair coupling factor [Candidatus Omnitrophica bacterium]|nr:transcription-repair coupling factor [Candidatus Omnitrophota bacterium]
MFKRIECHVKQSCRPRNFVESLKTLNYMKKDFVEAPGEFSHRGNLVDVYPFNFNNPVRIEFVFGEIESIRDFIVENGELGASYNDIMLIPVHEHFASRKTSDPVIQDEDDYSQHFYNIKKGDYVVHLDHGIGQYLGTKKIKVKGVLTSYFAIEYAGREILYVDIDGPQVFERYVGLEGRAPKLNKLNSKEWKRTKERTRLSVRVIARDMLELQARREVLKGFAFTKDGDWQKEFEEQFEYTETEDQLKATADVKVDMESEKPMDRLLCGDVGYGKTEVAMRAAFKAVMSGKQVAFLVPTTILAEQHYLTLLKRVKSFPVHVEVLSRFRTKKEQEGIVTSLRDGSCDIVVGTHRLLSSDICFKDLGLVIIDEEQRFGVRHKEKLKHMRAVVDVLTLTATPIPRTLYLSLMGARDMSVINTPPKTRLAIETEVVEYKDEIVKAFIERELERRGQVYFVHNRVQSIERVHDRLKTLLPQVSFCIGHGQMLPRELEGVMLDFMEGKIDCLIATSIIESGIDIPNVNTIIIDRADMFGLSDLYQLRGRVGRYQEKRKAYACFLVPKGYLITKDATKRLSAIERFTDLGSGFKIAMEDLEIRGAGNILGHEQSGFIYQVGFDLYCRLLREVIKEEQKKTDK